MGILLLGAPSTSFNGFLAQVNPNFPAIGGDFPFINMFKNGAGWNNLNNSGSPSPASFDSNGYPLGIGTLANSGVFQVIRIPTATNGGTNYVVRTIGKGTVSVAGTVLTSTISTISSPDSSHTTFNLTTGGTDGGSFDFRIGMEAPLSGISGTMGTALNNTNPVITSLTASSITCATANTTTLSGSGGTAKYGRVVVGVATGGRVVVSIAGSPVSLNVGITSSDTVSPITDLAFIAQGSEEVRYEAGEVFGAKFLARLAEGKFGVIRGLNVLQTNISTEITWSQRKPQGYYTYGFDIMQSSIFAGTTASTNAGNDYTISPGFGALVDKKQVTLAFDAATVTVSSASPAVINFPLGHGFVVGNPFNFFTSFGGTMPIELGLSALAATSTTYFVESIVDSNNVTFAKTSGGAAVNTSSSGTGTIKAHATVVTKTITFASSSTNVGWAGHLLNVGDPVGVGNNTGNLPAGYQNQSTYYVKTVVDANNVTLAATPGGTAISAGTVSGTFSGIRLPTLNMDGAGAIPIRDRRCNPLQTASSPTTTPKAFSFTSATVYATLTYDKLLNCWSMFGANDNDAGSHFICNAWPPEIFLQLCIKARAHPWFPSPVWVLDGYTDPSTNVGGITDYMPSLMAYVRDNKPSWMIPRFEPHNENWNNLFSATAIGKGHSYVLWGTESIDQYVGKISSVLGQAAANVFGSVGNGYQLVVGVQTAVANSTAATNSHDPRLTASAYVAQAAAAQTGYSIAAAYPYATHVCCSQYVSPGAYGTSLETTWVTNSIATFTATISGTVMTATGAAGASLAVGMTVCAASGTNNSLITGNPTIASFGTGAGGNGTYNLSGSSQPAESSTSATYFACDLTSSGNSALYIDTMQGSSFTGTISGTALTVNTPPGVNSPPIATGQCVTGVGVQPNTVVQSGSGTNWVVSVSQTVGPVAMNSGTFTVPALNQIYQNIFTWAQQTKFINNAGAKIKLCGYEGGYSPDYAGAATLTDFRGAGKLVAATLNQATGLSYYVAQTYRDFVAAGGEYPSLFQLSGISVTADAWSALGDVYQSPNSAYWNGVLAFQP